jgi:hypothetical protein
MARETFLVWGFWYLGLASVQNLLLCLHKLLRIRLEDDANILTADGGGN